MAEVEYALQDNLTGEILDDGFASEGEALTYLADSYRDYRNVTIVRRDRVWTEWFEAFA